MAAAGSRAASANSQPPRHACKAERCARAEARSFLVIGREARDGSGKRRHVAGRHERSGQSRFDQSRVRRNVARDDRQSGGHGLEHGIGMPFVA